MASTARSSGDGGRFPGEEKRRTTPTMQPTPSPRARPRQNARECDAAAVMSPTYRCHWVLATSSGWLSCWGHGSDRRGLGQACIAVTRFLFLESATMEAQHTPQPKAATSPGELLVSILLLLAPGPWWALSILAGDPAPLSPSSDVLPAGVVRTTLLLGFLLGSWACAPFHMLLRFRLRGARRSLRHDIGIGLGFAWLGAWMWTVSATIGV